MTIADKLAGLAQRAPALIEHLETEEATKNALVMPLYRTRFLGHTFALRGMA